MESFISYLNNTFSDIKKKNQSYSLRSFARKLEENPGHLSKVLRGESRITSEKIYKYAKALKLPKDQICDFLIYHLEENSINQD